MAGSGRISVLVSKELQTILTVARRLDSDVRARLRLHTKAVAGPEWAEATRARVETRLQSRVLADTARVAVSDSNITLRSATIGRVHGTPTSVLAGPAEFGADPTRPVQTRSRKGTPYTRRMGGGFGPPRRNGTVFFPAFRDIAPRMVSLWMQTTRRTVAEQFEKGQQ